MSNKKLILIGGALAALAGALQYFAAALPAPYGPVASALLVVIAALMKSPLAKGSN